MTFSAMLALPQLGAVRSRIAVNSGDAVAAKAVLALHEAGRFDPGALHPARAFPGALALMQGVFWRWIRAMQGQFEHASFSMAVGVGAGSAIDDPTGDGYGHAADDAREILEIVLGNKPNDPLGTVWILKRRYEAIERAVPGLARTALTALGLASRSGLALWTPWMTLEAASWAYWGGCNDEREYVESMGEEGDDAEEMGILTRAELDRAIPPEVSLPREMLKPRELERIARGRSDAARIAGLCLEIRSAVRRDRARKAFADFVPERISETARLHHFAAVRWSDDDPSFRIYDDWANPAYENGEALEAYGWHEVPIESAALKIWFAGMERTFRVAALGQQLLALIAEEEA